MSEQQEPKQTKVVHIQRAEPRPASPLPITPDIDPRIVELVAQAAGIVFARENALLLQNKEQYAQAVKEELHEQRQYTAELAELVVSMRDERDKFRSSAERFAAQMEEVQIGAREVNAVRYDIRKHGPTPDLANFEIGSKELAYPLFSAQVAAALNISPTVAPRIAKACGIWEDPDYHARLPQSAKGTTYSSKYKERAIEKMREFLEYPDRFDLNPDHPDWSLRKYCRPQQKK